MKQFDLRTTLDAGQKIASMLTQRGTVANFQFAQLSKGLTPEIAADTVHFLSALHGRHPSLIDTAAGRLAEPDARQWLLAATQGFRAERDFLARLIVAVGPYQSTMGNDEASAILPHMGRAFEMLATSDRAGCAAGVCVAFIYDWAAVRTLLSLIAATLDINPPPNSLPAEQENIDICAVFSASAAHSRAMLFGADQYLAQQQGLWDLVMARHRARQLSL